MSRLRGTVIADENNANKFLSDLDVAFFFSGEGRFILDE